VCAISSLTSTFAISSPDEFLLLFVCLFVVSPIGELIESHDVSYHQFADDTQLLVAMNVNNAGPALERLANCSTAVRLWFLQNDLKLNADNSEVVILGIAPQLRSAANIHEVDVAGSRLQVEPKLKSLGVTIDSHLRFTPRR